eukprot:TRINITY_DN30953_c0_g1_i1.p1 TRINITY_DN30953_c0_g1~~TRINITY_DN30953_c0_g1_i1.p1  ORF type:complete len:901 (-),score=164.95 TRINITY_DN30953_c0_g1_i1:81-2783(-)
MAEAMYDDDMYDSESDEDHHPAPQDVAEPSNKSVGSTEAAVQLSATASTVASAAASTLKPDMSPGARTEASMVSLTTTCWRGESADTTDDVEDALASMSATTAAPSAPPQQGLAPAATSALQDAGAPRREPLEPLSSAVRPEGAPSEENGPSAATPALVAALRTSPLMARRLSHDPARPVAGAGHRAAAAAAAANAAGATPWRPGGAPGRSSAQASSSTNRTQSRERPQSAARRPPSANIGPQAGGQRRPPPAPAPTGQRGASSSSQSAYPKLRGPGAAARRPQACRRDSSCTCAACAAEYGAGDLEAAEARRLHEVRRRALLAYGDCSSEWPQLPDVVLLQAIVLLGPAEVSAAAAVCSTWAETVTASEAWLWSVVGSAGAGLPDGVFSMLEQWASASDMAVRNAMQLWLCRAHLWGSSGASSSWPCAGASAEASGGRQPVASIECPPLPCTEAQTCCGAWPGGGPGEVPGAAIATAGGVLTFCRMSVRQSPACGLRGIAISSMEVVASVRAAHGRDLITAVQPLGPSGRRAISSGLDGLLRIWDCSTAAEVAQIHTEHVRGVNTVVVSPGFNVANNQTGGEVLTCGDDGTVLLYDVGDALAAAGAAASNTVDPCCRFETGHSAAAYCAAWASGDTFATGGFDRKTLLWDKRAGPRPVMALPTQKHVYALAPLVGYSGSGRMLSEDGLVQCQALATGLSDGTVAYWDLRQPGKQPLKELRGHAGPVESLAVLPGDVLASASSDGSMRLWDASRGGDPAWAWQGGRGALTSVAAVLEDALLVVGVSESPMVHALDYSAVAMKVPEVLSRLRLPSLQPWRRTRKEGGGLASPPPEGHGRHSQLLQERRRKHGSVRGAAADADPYIAAAEPRGVFDRSTKTKAPSLGATGAAHRAYLCGLRR